MSPFFPSHCHRQVVLELGRHGSLVPERPEINPFAQMKVGE